MSEVDSPDETTQDFFSRLSASSRQALAIANKVRQQVTYRQGNDIFTELLLIGLNELTKATPRAVLSAYGIGRMRLLTELLNPQDWSVPRTLSLTPDELDQSPETLAKLPYSANLQEIFGRASEISAEKNATNIRARHLFLALLRNRDCFATRWLIEETSFSWNTVVDKLSSLKEDQDVEPNDFGYAPGVASADMPSEKDTLGFSPYTQALAEIIIKKETIPPVVFGLYGPWGSGKSTFLGQVQKHLEQWKKESRKSKNQLPRIVCMPFNAWAYTDSTRLWAGLVKQISAQLDDEIRWWQRPWYWLKRAGWRFLGAVILSLLPVFFGIGIALITPLWQNTQHIEIIRLVVAAVGTIGSITFIGQQKPLSSIVQTELKNIDRTEIDGVINRIQKEFQTTVKDYFNLTAEEQVVPGSAQAVKAVQQNKLKVVVFIDELDRCPLEKIVDILEAIKLFLAEEIFIVLMAVDTRVASEAIRLHYKEVKNPELAREYLEKIIQVPIPIPSADASSLSQYLDHLMVFPPMQPTPVPNAESSVEIYIAAERSTPLPVMEQPFKPLNLTDTNAEKDALMEFTQKYLGSNPRRIKRLLNTYRYVKILAYRRGERTDKSNWQRQMIFWLGTTMRWPYFIHVFIDQISSQHTPPNEEELMRIWQQTYKMVDSNLCPPVDILNDLSTDYTRIRELSRFADNFIQETPRSSSLHDSKTIIRLVPRK